MVNVAVGIGVDEGVGGGSVLVGITDVEVGIVIAVAVGVGLATPQPANRTAQMVRVSNFRDCFSRDIDLSISNSMQDDNWLKRQFWLHATSHEMNSIVHHLRKQKKNGSLVFHLPPSAACILSTRIVSYAHINFKYGNPYLFQLSLNSIPNSRHKYNYLNR